MTIKIDHWQVVISYIQGNLYRLIGTKNEKKVDLTFKWEAEKAFQDRVEEAFSTYINLIGE